MNGAGERVCRGFTLIEVLVAFAVLAVAMTLLLGMLSRSYRQVQDAAEATRATLYARSVLEEAAVGNVVPIGRTDGAFEAGRFRWTLSVQPWTEEPLSNGNPGVSSPLRLLLLDLELRWGDRPDQRLHVRSLRLARQDFPGAPAR